MFISYKGNKEYIIFSNYYNDGLGLLTLLDNKKILSLQEHPGYARTIRYFNNNNTNNFNDNLISWDDYGIAIVRILITIILLNIKLELNMEVLFIIVY